MRCLPYHWLSPDPQSQTKICRHTRAARPSCRATTISDAPTARLRIAPERSAPFCLARPEGHRLMNLHAFHHKLQVPLHRMICGVVQVRAGSERCAGIAPVQRGRHIRVANGDISAGGQEHFLPNAHVLVRRRGVPIHPVMPRSSLPGAEISRASALGLPPSRYFVTSNS